MGKHARTSGMVDERAVAMGEAPPIAIFSASDVNNQVLSYKYRTL